MPRRLLIVIFLTRLQSRPAGASFWQNALNVIPPPTSLEQAAHGTPPVVKRCGMTPVFRTLYTPPTTSLSPTQEIDLEFRTQELLGILFEALLPEAVDAGTFLQHLVESFQKMPGASDEILNVDCRAYQPYLDSDPMSGGFAPTQGGTLVINCMTPSPESEEVFNKWYKEEHLPVLSAVPGWRSSSRFVLVDSRHTLSGDPANAPKYLAMYEWIDDGIFDTKEYKAAINTPWRTEVISAVQEKQRWVLGHIGMLEEWVSWE